MFPDFCFLCVARNMLASTIPNPIACIHEHLNCSPSSKYDKASALIGIKKSRGGDFYFIDEFQVIGKLIIFGEINK